MPGYPDLAQRSRYQFYLTPGFQGTDLVKLLVQEIDGSRRNFHIEPRGLNFKIPNTKQHGAPLLHSRGLTAGAGTVSISSQWPTCRGILRQDIGYHLRRSACEWSANVSGVSLTVS